MIEGDLITFTPEQLAKIRKSTITETQDCKRGEHRYITGKRHCPLCGKEL